MNILLREKVQQNKTDIMDCDFNMKLLAEKIELHKKHLETMRQNNDDLIKQKQDKISEFKTSIAKNASEVEKTVKVIEELQKTLPDQTKTKSKIEKVRGIVTQLEQKQIRLEKEIEFFSEHNDCPTCRQGIDHIHKKQIVSNDNQQILEVSGALEKLNHEWNNLENKMIYINDTLKTIQEHNLSISTLSTQNNTLGTFITGLEQEIEGLNKDTRVVEDNSEELKQFKQQLKDFITSKEELSQYKMVLDVASMLLKDSGIKTKIIKQYVPIINKLINKYLAAMDFFVNFELDENFEEKIKSRHRDEFSYESFSEGEKMRIDLALLFTWRAVAKLRNSASTNLLIMDEVFDSSLDANGTDEFLKILSGLTGDTNVFIISHKGDTLFDKFENIIKFEKVKNFSRIA